MIKNNKDFKKSINVLKEVRLTILEKDESFKKIMKCAGVNFSLSKKCYFTYLDFLKIRGLYSYVVTSVLFVLLVGGGTAYAAQGTLPGDILYPIKININEPVIGALAFSASDEANWQTEKIDKRVIEAEELARQGRLSGVSTENILASINNSVDVLDKNISDLNGIDIEKANNAKLDLAVNSDIHSKVLTEIKNTTNAQQVNDIQLVENAMVNAVEKVGMKSFLNIYSIGGTKTDVITVASS